MVDAMLIELKQRVSYLKHQGQIETVYFGGGTPSLLSVELLGQLVTKIQELYPLSDKIEFTIEANPDDLTKSKLEQLWELGFNRLSIGIQSFDEEVLNWMNRSHSSKQASNCVGLAQQVGFKNISADLIYGLPSPYNRNWQANLSQLFELSIQHFSAYCLTVEPNTSLWHSVNKGIIKPLAEEHASVQFNQLMDHAADHGFEHYEISNFSLPNLASKHNSNYWNGIPYLGIGPSAHSFNGSTRSWNISNNAQYIAGQISGSPNFDFEKLSHWDLYNEHVMIGLRRSLGINKCEIVDRFGLEYWQHAESALEIHLKQGLINLQNGVATLTQDGKHLADKIASDLFAT